MSVPVGGSSRDCIARERIMGVARPQLLLGLLVLPGYCLADANFEALKRMSVEELMNIEVTSVSRRPERLLQAPAAIEVIRNEDIRRSTASSIPGALELASNLSVAQRGAHEWVISSRGFSSDVGNKLLVLFDGRTVYTPLFSGVFWDRQDYVLADIDRIEVISGPGGTLYGSNAVNGVINITTKTAKDTQGLYVEAGGGTNPDGFASLRYGGEVDSDVHYRVYGKIADRASESLSNGADARDGWRAMQAGFRIDMQPSESSDLTLQGDVFRNDTGIVSGRESTTKAGNLLGRWSRARSPAARMSLQVYYDRTDLALPVAAFGAVAPAGTFKDVLDTYDIDFQDRFEWGARQRIVWGLGYRYTHDVVDNAPGLGFSGDLNQSLYSAFLQDEITLWQGLALTLGTKLEHTAYTGFEYEPNIRLQWDLTDSQVIWGAVSRAIRAPSRIDRDFSQPEASSPVVVLRGDRDFQSEKLLAYELGFRAQVSANVGISLATFYNDYDDVRSTSLSPPDPALQGLPFPLFFENNLEANTYGFELNTTVQVLEGWRVQAGYQLLLEDVSVKRGKMDFNRTRNETSDPEQQFSLRSSFDFGGGFELDAAFRWVDIRPVNNADMSATVPDFTDLNVRLGWRPSEAWDVSLNGENLLEQRHPEYGFPGPMRVEIKRSVYGKFVRRF